MKVINWGMIGAGDVTEVKSGPAFKKVPNSDLIAVMRRDEEKVKDYAKRHLISHWYTDADELILNPNINAVYIATPPNAHLLYVEKALKAGKMVYVEKPVALNTSEALEMQRLVCKYDEKLVVAHYRRAIPYFLKIQELVKGGSIGVVSRIDLKMFKSRLSDVTLLEMKHQWRVNPAISGGGLFHDLAPHQIDILILIFGHPKRYGGLSNTTDQDVATRVCGQMLFENDIMFNGVWDFDQVSEVDHCVIVGDRGSIEFSFFEGMPIVLKTRDGNLEFSFAALQHVQQPMIASVVQYFLDNGPNPCPIEEGIIGMQVMDAFVKS